jgi:phosphate-selective porin
MDAVQPLKSVVTSVSQNGTTKNVTVKTANAVTRPVLLDANIDYNLYSTANFRIGQFYVPFGKENTISDSLMDTINRSQVTEKLVPGRDIGSQGRDIGLQVGGSADFGTGKKLVEYAAGIFNGAGMNTGDDNEQKDFAGRAQVFPFNWITGGISVYSGKYGSTEADKTRAGAEIAILFCGVSLKSEYVSGKDGPVEKYGWYVQSGYKFLSSLETVLKYDSYDPDNNTQGDRSDIITLGENWFIGKNAKIQINYEWKKEEVIPTDNNDLIAQCQIQF